MKSHFRFIALLALMFMVFVPAAFSQAVPSKITQLSLEDLMNTEVTSVTRSAQPLSQTPSAITVISSEDIRRSTATNIPELLRMVPGMHVAQINAHDWAIGTRGFSGSLNNKMLVLIDGRSVYTPLHSGVFWDVQDTMLENIERIEIIRGPGASVWGSNAVNGVVNIITKDSRDTQGGVIKGYGGSEFQSGAGSYSSKAGNTTYRAYGKYFNRDSSYLGNDAWYLGRGGLRTDTRPDEKNVFTFDGEYYTGEEDVRGTLLSNTSPFVQIYNDDSNIAGGHLLGRWNHIYGPASDSTLQIYFDQTKRDTPTLSEDLYTYDVDWQHRFAANDRNEVVWGLGIRAYHERTEGSFGAYFDPSRQTDFLYHGFIQDTFAVRDNLWLTAGTKLEHNEYSGFEVQPTARVLWQPHEKHTLWAAFSRAVRIPSRLDHDLVISAWLTPGAALARAYGDSERDSEKVMAYEVGYRVQPHAKFTVDTAAFINKHTGLTTLRAGSIVPENSYVVQQLYIDDNADAYTFGTEISGKFQATDHFRFDIGYTFIQILVEERENPFGSAKTTQEETPEHQLFFRPSLDLPGNFEIDAPVRYVTALKSISIPAYWEMDLRLAWRPADRYEFAVVGQNLFHNHHAEFTNASKPQRAVYGKTTVKF